MVSELHGYCYYIMLEDLQETFYVNDIMAEESVFKDEKFFYTRHPSGKYIFASESRCGSWRGEKYSAWERVKRKVYRHRKESKTQ